MNPTKKAIIEHFQLNCPMMLQTLPTNPIPQSSTRCQQQLIIPCLPSTCPDEDDDDDNNDDDDDDDDDDNDDDDNDGKSHMKYTYFGNNKAVA